MGGREVRHGWGETGQLVSAGSSSSRPAGIWPATQTVHPKLAPKHTHTHTHAPTQPSNNTHTHTHAHTNTQHSQQQCAPLPR
jgi:hypothetical protein